MKLDEILKTATQTLSERLNSPLLGSFVIAWALWNWKFLVILFSSAGVTQTFALVEKLAFPDATAVLTHGLLYPALTAAFYIFLYPFPARFVYEYSLRRQREVNQTKQKIEDETPLTIEESRRLRAEYVEYERRNTEVVQGLNEQIARLNAALEAATKAPSHKSQSSSDESTPHRLEPSQLALLKKLAGLDSPALEEDLIETSAGSRVKVEFDIGELERQKFLHRNYDQVRHGYTLEFTHDGRKALLEGDPGAS